MKRFMLLIVGALLAGAALFAAPAVNSSADGDGAPIVAAQTALAKPGHSARIHHRVDSKVHSLKVCKDRVSLTKCSTKKHNTFSITRGMTTAKGIDIDGYFCPAYKKCSVSWGIFSRTDSNRQGKKEKFFAVRGPLTYKVRVY